MNMVARTLKIFIGGPLLVVVLFLFGLGAWSAWQNRNDTFRYRLTVEVASGSKVYTASGVTQVKMHINGLIAQTAAWPEVTGDALVVEVPDRGPIFALLTAKNNGDWDANIAFQVFYDRLPDPKGKSGGQVFRDNTATLSHLREKAEVPRELYPLMVAFRDINVPAGVYEVYPRDLSPPLDPGGQVVRMTIEMTDEPVTGGTVARLLPWVDSLPGHLDGAKYGRPGTSFANSLTRLDFRKRGT